MAASKSNNVVLASTLVAAGTTKFGAPSAKFDTLTGYGGIVSYQITNGASAPTGLPTLTLQFSGDGGGTWSDLATVYGDILPGSLNTGAIPVDIGVMAIRALPYGHATNPVTFAVQIQQAIAL